MFFLRFFNSGLSSVERKIYTLEQLIFAGNRHDIHFGIIASSENCRLHDYDTGGVIIKNSGIMQSIENRRKFGVVIICHADGGISFLPVIVMRENNKRWRETKDLAIMRFLILPDKLLHCTLDFSWKKGCHKIHSCYLKRDC